MAKDDFTAFLGAGTEYQGQLAFKGTVRIDCRFVGNITSDGKLILGKDAVVEGSVTVKELEAQGTLNGDAFVANRTTLHRHARVSGTLSTPVLIMEDGALLQGQLIMDKEACKAQSAVTGARQQLTTQPERGMPMLDAAVEH